MACYSVLRIGPLADDNAALLRSSISSRFTSSTKSDGTPEDCISISNRYFNAAILLKGLHESVSLDADSVVQEDGVVLIFNASSDAPPTQSFDSLQSIHSSIEQTAGELLRLCIGITNGPSPLSDGSKKSEEEYSRRVLWCLDRGYEYVDVDVSEEGMKRGHDARDKEGFARVVEAIECCMWSSHVMKPRGAGATADATKANAVETSDTNKADVQGEKKTETTASTDSAVNSTTSNSDDATREAAAMASLMKAVNETEPQDNSPHDDRQQELSFSELEQIMTEAKRIREASKSDSITDEERRQRAGDTAVRLIGLLEKLGFDDEDEEDDDDDSDGGDKK